MIKQSAKMAWKSIAANKLRSFLTMLGIIIGVMALVVLVSLVSGTTSSVTDQINSIGTNQLNVMISDDKGKPMKISDVLALAEYDEIAAAAPSASSSMTAVNGSTSETATVYGTTSSYAELQGLELSSGRFIKNADVENHTNVAVISSDMATEIVGTRNAVGQTIKMDGISYQIIGILAEDDTETSSSSVYEAYIPYTALIRQTNSVSSDITSFVAAAADGYTQDEAEEKLTEYLNSRFSNDEDAYTIMNSSAIAEAMTNVTSMLSIMLGGIAAISLLVGGIGIMNIMLVSVTERTREIGIRKAIGASRGVIMLQFLIEALMVSMIGCIIGIVLSWITLKIVAVFASSLSMSFTLSFPVVWVAVLFCFFIGVVFGLYPANKAAKKNPIEALRYMG